MGILLFAIVFIAVIISAIFAIVYGKIISQIIIWISSLFRAERFEVSGKIIFLRAKEVEYSIPSLSSEYSFDLYSSMKMTGKEFFALVKKEDGGIVSVILPDEKFYQEALIKKANKEPVRWLCTKFLWFLLVKKEIPVATETSFVT